MVRGLDGKSEFTVAAAIALREIMDERGVRQAAIAETMGRSQGYVSEHTTGRRAIDTEMIAAVAAVAGVAPETIALEVVDRVSSRRNVTSR